MIVNQKSKLFSLIGAFTAVNRDQSLSVCIAFNIVIYQQVVNLWLFVGHYVKSSERSKNEWDMATALK